MTPYSPFSGIGLAGNPMSGMGFLDAILRPKNNPTPDNVPPPQADSAEPKGNGKEGLMSALGGLGKNKKLKQFDYSPQVGQAEINPTAAQSFLSMLFGA